MSSSTVHKIHFNLLYNVHKLCDNRLNTISQCLLSCTPLFRLYIHVIVVNTVIMSKHLNIKVGSILFATYLCMRLHYTNELNTTSCWYFYASPITLITLSSEFYFGYLLKQDIIALYLI